MADFQSQLVRSNYEFKDAAKLAVDSVRAHKLRSFLTLLGVIIGVASVILVGAAIEGLGVYAEESTAKAFGADSFLVAQIANAGNMSRTEFLNRLRKHKEIKLEDLSYLQQVNGDELYYSAYRQASRDIKRDELIAEDASIIGTNADLPSIRDITLTEGRFFTEQEDQYKMFVAVIGDETKTRLFPEAGSPIGKTFKIDGMDFTVIGVQEKLGSAFGRSQDLSVYLPITTFTRMFGPARSLSIFGKAKPETGMAMESAVDLTRAALRSRFHTRLGAEDNFDTLTPDAIRGFIEQIMGMIAAVVVPVTLISLVVGGIVIMNIMLVSVTERTREIGIRKALGARQTDIMQQILIESVLLASLGGFIGLTLGAVLTAALSKAFGIRMSITLTYVVLAIGVSSVVGIVSGWYPARRAARLDPIVALRAE